MDVPFTKVTSRLTFSWWAMDVAHLVERSLPIPEVRSSNPDIGKFYIEHLFTISCIEKTKIKKKRPVMSHNQKTFSWRKTKFLTVVVDDKKWLMIITHLRHKKCFFSLCSKLFLKRRSVNILSSRSPSFTRIRWLDHQLLPSFSSSCCCCCWWLTLFIPRRY